MTSLSTLIYLPRSIGIFANGIFTGLGWILNLVSVPAIKVSKDPLPSFIAILTIFTGTAANATCYYKTNETRFIYSTLLSFISFSFTILFIAPVNNQLFALQKLGDEYDRNKVQNLLASWNRLQVFRTIVGIAAFIINIMYKQ